MLGTALRVLALAVAGQTTAQPVVGAAPFWHFTVTGADANGNKSTQVRAASGIGISFSVFPLLQRASSCASRQLRGLMVAANLEAHGFRIISLRCTVDARCCRWSGRHTCQAAAPSTPSHTPTAASPTRSRRVLTQHARLATPQCLAHQCVLSTIAHCRRCSHSRHRGSRSLTACSGAPPKWTPVVAPLILGPVQARPTPRYADCRVEVFSRTELITESQQAPPVFAAGAAHLHRHPVGMAWCAPDISVIGDAQTCFECC